MDQDRQVAETNEEMICPIELTLGKENVRPITLNQRAPAVVADLISDHGTDIASDRANERHQPEVEPSGISQISGERHNHFRGQGNAGGLDCHQQHHSQVASGGDDGDYKQPEFCGKAFDHSVSTGKERSELVKKGEMPGCGPFHRMESQKSWASC